MTQAASGWQLERRQGLSIMAMGAGIGWLMALSASPVVAGVIASLIGIGGGIIAGLRGVRSTGKGDGAIASTALDARPAALFVLAMVLTATLGLVVKSHRLLEPDYMREAAMRSAARGLQDTQASADLHSALLFKVPQRECSLLLSLRGNEAAFVGELSRSTIPGASQLSQRIKDPQTLIIIVEALCERP